MQLPSIASSMALVTALLTLPQLVLAQNTSYINPILPGWHSDPSCVFVPSLSNTTFCTTSTFLAFPSCPIYASQDLLHRTLDRNVISRPSQVPELRTSTNQQTFGMFANTLRFHNGTFYLISAWLNADAEQVLRFVLFTSDDPFNEAGWSDVKWVDSPGDAIDPDIFFDDDGSVIVAMSGTPSSLSPRMAIH